MKLICRLSLLGFLFLVLSCSRQEDATPDATATFAAAVSAELTRLAPTAAVAADIVPTPTLAAVATAALPQSDPTPTLFPTATLIPIVIQNAIGDRQGIQGDVFSRSDVQISADPPIFGDKITFFMVGAVDNQVGVNEGDGILDIVFSIYDAAGNLVYQKVETTPAYCAFGGDFPCVPHDFSQSSYLWPSGIPLEAGSFSAIIVARGLTPDRVATWTYDFQIQLEP